MDRAIVYAGSIPLDTDLLRAGRYAKAGLGNLAEITFGSQSAVACGLVCVPSANSLSVTIGRGSVLAPGVLDGASVGGLGGGLVADNTAVMCQYVSTTDQSVAIPYAGSIFTLYAVCQEQDTDTVVLPFFNASNPDQTLAGASNGGGSLPTRRAGLISFVIAAAAPVVPDNGYILPLYRISVPLGATTAVSVAVTAMEGVFPTPLPKLAPLQSPALTGQPTTPTPDGSNLQQILNFASLAKFASGRLVNIAGFWSAGSYNYTPSAGTQSVIVIVQGGGASGYGSPATGAGQVGLGSGGGSGAFAAAWIPGVGATQSIPITVGVGGAAIPGDGATGGNSSFGSWVNCSGGVPGTISGVVTPIWSQGSKSTALPVVTGGAVPIVSRAGECGGVSLAFGVQSGTGGQGASSAFGAGGAQMPGGVSGASGGQGAGGSGTFNIENNSTALAGGAGGAGVVVVLELA
ncbi:hypothetical protein [Gluconobacter wancherniae]|uniref:Uncharacterized protein n=1 Tax=Gluconobacter wancherniae NBRC 103581 TaxID=656744 RepID=A0A511AZY7_9PROT|nr:hypothetical protein [Gluconobacter wancherniae]MBF0854401.1 hypothetical protein [Gluconobacter wancherniae]GBD57462.1 hypothetical protein NBRC103581_02050 [Gluconobacter wancherniae NBRC 103581]GEK93764.1 hypothetical protein GWA01_15340 [Gluconobacter wancherniae NBRC 103581]